MNWKNKTMTSVMILGFMLPGCGSGDGGVGAGTGSIGIVGGTPGDGGSSTGSGTFTGTPLFFSGGSILAVDSSNPSAAPVQLEMATTTGEDGPFHGTYNAINKTVTGAHFPTLIYANKVLRMS